MAKKKPKGNPLDNLLDSYAAKHKVSNSTNLASLDLFDFLVTASPHLRRPEHLESIVPYLLAVEHSPQFFAFSAPPRHGKPLGGSTLITMGDGTLKHIRDIKVGEYVIGGHGKITEVTNKFEQGYLPVYKIKTYLGREIIAEGSHNFLTKKGWKRVDELISYDTCHKPDRLVPLSDYNIYETHIDPEEARFLGYMIGDGSCRSYTTTKQTIQSCAFTCANLDVLNRFERCVKSIGGSITKIKSSKYSYGCPGMRDILRKHDLAGRGSHTKIVPKSIFSAQREAILAFLAGYMETDGTRPHKNHTNPSFSSVNKELLVGIQHLLSRLDIRSALRIKNGIYKGTRHISWRLSIHDSKRFFDIVPVVGPKGGPGDSSTRRHGIGDTVMSVKPSGLEECFCITVADSSSFLADGVVTHNSVLINHFVAWMMIRHPGIKIAYGCYGLKLALFFSDEVKDILKSNGYEIDRNRNSREEWRLENGSLFKAVAPGTDFTGRGADIIIIDDPYKNRVTAESGAIRDMTWNWFSSVAFLRRSPNASIVVTHCIAKDEPILMADGTWRSVQDVKAGEYVKSYSNGKFSDFQVLDSRKSGTDPILSVNTKRKSLRVNERHPFLLSDGTWKKAKDLNIGDDVVVFTGETGTEKIDPEYAWFLGFFLGDGWVTEWGGGKKWCACIAKGVYPEINKRVVDGYVKFFNRKPAETKFGYYRLDSVIAGRQLRQAGVTGGAWHKRVPEWIYRLSPELKIAFLRGYANADGTSARRCNDTWIVGSVSLKLIEDIRRLAISAGVSVCAITSSSQIVKAPHSKSPKLSTIYKVQYNFAANPNKTETITSIESHRDEDVYDLSIANSENFIANGFVVHNTRWNIEDIIGVLSRDHNVPYVNLQAVSDDGDILWPSEWSAEKLTEIRKITGEYGWASLYMGEPRPRGGAVFGDPTTYTDEEFEQLEKDGLIKKYVIGIDCAYTKKTHSDYSVAVVLAIDTAGKSYVVDVVRKQCEASEFAIAIKQLRLTYNGATVYWYTGGQEKVIAEFFKNSHGLPIKTVTAKEDKFARAQSVAAAWNSRRVLVPEDHRNWSAQFLTEVLTFSGLGDPNDDQVDALAAAFIPHSKPKMPRGLSQTPVLPY